MFVVYEPLRFTGKLKHLFSFLLVCQVKDRLSVFTLLYLWLLGYKAPLLLLQTFQTNHHESQCKLVRLLSHRHNQFFSKH